MMGHGCAQEGAYAKAKGAEVAATNVEVAATEEESMAEDALAKARVTIHKKGGDTDTLPY